MLLEGDRESWHALTTLAEAAAVAGVDPGAPSDVFAPETELSPDDALSLDPAAAERIADALTYNLNYDLLLPLQEVKILSDFQPVERIEHAGAYYQHTIVFEDGRWCIR